MRYVFDPESLHTIVRSHLRRGDADLCESIPDSLAKRYPRHIDRDAEWIFNNAGGAMGHMRVLHASLNEYLILFGTPIGTEGHTGRFFVDDWFFILEGEQWAYEADAREREVYRPGDVHHLRRGVAKGYKVPDRCYALEYARGIIPLMLPFGIADTLSSTVDYVTLAHTVKSYARGVMSSLRGGTLRAPAHTYRGERHRVERGNPSASEW
jgi:C-8 sterol isomerase